MARLRSCPGRSTLLWLLLLWGIAVPNATAQLAVLYSTGFEPSEGFDKNLSLVEQLGWTGIGTDGRPQTDGNGIVEGFFPDSDQQAFIGFSPLTGTNYTLNVWRPLNFDPVAVGKPVVTFTVQMSIFDSTTNRYDCFRWSVYNKGGTRLFTLDFDNATLGINYLLDDEEFVSTGFAFEHEGLYDLELAMNFANNRWSATLTGSQNETLIVNSRRITTRGSALDLGDIDAVWVYGPTNNVPGDNFMVFDNYHVTAEAATPLPFELQSLGPGPNGSFLLRLRGEPGRDYAIEVSQNLTSWTAIRTNSAGDGTSDFIDEAAAGISLRFYRARLVQ